MDSKEQDTGFGRPEGLFDSLKGMTNTLLAMAQTRLELLSTDLEEERAWLVSTLVWILVALFCAGMGVLLVTLFIVVLFWDTPYRLFALGTSAILFFLFALLLWWVVRRKVRTKTRLFSASLAELSKDREELISHS